MKNKTTAVIGAIALSACALAVARLHAQEPTLSSAETTAIGALNETFAKNLSVKNWKGAVALFTNDGVLYPVGESAVKGRTSIESCLAGLPPLSSFALRNTKIEGHDDLAYVQGTFAMTVTPPGASAPEQISGYFLEVLKRQPDGRWLIAVQMFTSH